MLRQVQKQSKTAKNKPKLYSMPICCDSQLSVICKVCGSFLTSLSSASHYVNIDIPHYRFGNHLLVLQDYLYPNLKIDHENQIFNTEQPFLMMFLKKVYCGYCADNCVGLYFETVNVLETEWLLQHFSINMEEVALQQTRSSLMDSTINQLYALLKSVQNAKKPRKIAEKAEWKKKKIEKEKNNSILYQKGLQKFIKDNNYKGFQQNRLKNEVSTRILDSLAFFDRRTQRLEKEYKLVVQNAENLKKKIVTQFSTIQSFKAFGVQKRKQPI